MILGDIIRFIGLEMYLRDAILVRHQNSNDNYIEYYFDSNGKLEIIKYINNSVCVKTVMLGWDFSLGIDLGIYNLSTIHSRTYDENGYDILYVFNMDFYEVSMGTLEVRYNGKMHTYNIMDYEDSFEITDGYDSIKIEINKDGSIIKYTDIQGSTETYGYDDQGRLARIKRTSKYEESPILEYVFYKNFIPSKLMQLHEDRKMVDFIERIV